MDKKAKIKTLTALFIIVVIAAGFVLAKKPIPQCGDGVCRGGETQTNCPQDCGFPNSCSDTDGGIVVGTVGTVSGYINNQPYSKIDYCTDSIQLIENFCYGTQALSEAYNCPAGNSTFNSTANGCVNGACV